MNRDLLQWLADPDTKRPLRLDSDHSSVGPDITEGCLLDGFGSRYLIRHDIPRFVDYRDDAQQQTADSFGFKWQKWGAAGLTSSGLEHYSDWLHEKYGFQNQQDAAKYFGARQLILEAGCGMGMSSVLSRCGLPHNTSQHWIGVDISQAIDVARQRLGSSPNAHYVQADLMRLPFRSGSFDIIFSEGVLHHTPSTKVAIHTLAPLLKVGGDLLFYVYRKKGPIREFSDDFIRDQIAGLPADAAWNQLIPLTKLAKALADLKVQVDVPEAIPFLGIPQGPQDIQRLIYWSFLKLFWNDRYSFEENHHINFDWYHPRYAHRQTEDEVRTWCNEAGLSIYHFHTQESGFTVRATRSHEGTA